LSFEFGLDESKIVTDQIEDRPRGLFAQVRLFFCS
jgi:hypothetical protein